MRVFSVANSSELVVVKDIHEFSAMLVFDPAYPWIIVSDWSILLHRLYTAILIMLCNWLKNIVERSSPEMPMFLPLDLGLCSTLFEQIRCISEGGGPSMTFRLRLVKVPLNLNLIVKGLPALWTVQFCLHQEETELGCPR
jgi:hypothetical protein